MPRWSAIAGWVERSEAQRAPANPAAILRRISPLPTISPVGFRSVAPLPSLQLRMGGFTLVELVIVIAVSAVVLVLITTVLSSPMERLAEQRRRGELVDLAATALGRMARDVRLAVPNSLRISADGQAFELMETLSAERYRPNRLGGQGLRLSTAAAGSCGSTTASTRCDSVQVLRPGLNPAGVNWLVLYNIGAESAGVPLAGSNVWAPANPGVISPTGSSFSVVAGAPAGETEIAVNLPGGASSFDFAFASPQRRLYFAGAVIGYRCQGGQLLRYSYSQLLAAVPSSPPAGSSPQALANSVTVCRFNYQPGTTQRAGLLSLTLGLSQAGESVELMQQVHVDNAP